MTKNVSENKKSNKKDQKTESQTEAKVWKPGLEPLKSGEYLEYEDDCYELFDRFSLSWPCLSLSIIPNSLPQSSPSHPTISFVAGTQADNTQKNKIYVVNWSSTLTPADSTDSECELEDENTSNHSKKSRIHYCILKNEGATNRIRNCPKITRLVANWSDTGKVSIWDISQQLDLLDSCEDTSSVKLIHQSKNPPLFQFDGHTSEGYGLDWNPNNLGCLLTGDCNGILHLWETVEGGWSISSSNKFMGHTQSIEDIHWKPKGNGYGSIFATASTDGIMRVYDSRELSNMPSLSISGHEVDINVLQWNPLKEEMLLTADDHGYCKVWDTRFPRNELAQINFHMKPISSIGWHPYDDSTFASSSYDDAISFWDLSVEPENEFKESNTNENNEFPDQLMFLHMGQEQISEIQWHPNFPGIIVSTAVDGFNIFKTCNI